MEHSLNSIYSSASNAEDSASSIESTIGGIDITVDDICNMLAGSIYLLPQAECKINDILNELNIANTYDTNENLYIQESLATAYKKVKHTAKMKERLFNRRKYALKSIFPKISETHMKLLYEKTLYPDETE